MTDPQLDAYLKRFEKALAKLPVADKDDIVAETRSHLQGRAETVGMAAAIDSLGDPTLYALAFAEDTLAVNRSSFLTDLIRLSVLATSKPLAGLGIIISGLLLLLALTGSIFFFAELFASDVTGLWTYAPSGEYSFGFVSGTALENGTEILGRWLLLITAVVSFACLAMSRYVTEKCLKSFIDRS